MAVMLPRLLGAVVGLAVAGMVTAGPSVAVPITYYYTGFDFTSATGIYDTSMSLSGWFTRSSAFAANSSNAQDLTSPNGVTVFSFTDGVNTITSSNNTYWKIDINTDGAGNISDWDLRPQYLTDIINVLMESHGHGALDEVKTGAGGTDFDSLGIASNFSQLGSWAVGPTLLVLPAAVPLPAAFPLFATALAGMGLLGWRRRRKASA